MKTLKEIQTSCIKIVSPLLLFCMVSISSNSYALIDSTVFRVKVVQDSVYVGDTVDVDFFIGDGGLINTLNILNQFEMEVATDTSLIEQDKIEFKLDTASLTAFFGTTISNILSVTTIDAVTGKLNVKSNSNRTSNGGDARVGRGRYIVQDNAAGRQYMRFDYTKANSKDALGIANPVRTNRDSVLIIGRNNQIPTAIITRNNKNNNPKIYPNPAVDFIQIEGEKMSQYQLLSVDGNTILSVADIKTESIRLGLNEFNAGLYILKVLSNDSWSQYKIIKQ